MCSDKTGCVPGQCAVKYTVAALVVFALTDIRAFTCCRGKRQIYKFYFKAASVF